MFIFRFLFIVFGIILVPTFVLAHSGGTDATGGHTCWTNCVENGLRVGEYHYHDDFDVAVSTYDNNEAVYDRALAERLHGRILLQVDDHGEAWYVRSFDYKRYYMRDGSAAYEMMRYFSLGITDENLNKIPVVVDTVAMNAATSVCDSNSFANSLKGQILLQVEQRGEAWYVDPVKCHAIYMQDGAAAYEIMRYLGLGITNQDLNKVVIGAVQ